MLECTEVDMNYHKMERMLLNMPEDTCLCTDNEDD